MILLILSAGFNTLKWGYQFVNSPYHPIDFRGCYLSSMAYWNEMNPYSYEDQHILWERVNQYHSEWKMIVNSVYSTPLYPPQFVCFFGLYNLLDFTSAIWLQWTLNILSLLLIIFCIRKLNPNIKPWHIALFIMAFKGTWFAMDTGQPMLQVFAVCIYSYYLLEKGKHPVIPGLLMGLVSFKFTLLIPFIILFLARKWYTTVITIAACVILMNAYVLMTDASASEHLRSWAEKMAMMNNYLHDGSVLNGLSILATSVSVPLSYFFHLPETSNSAVLMFFTRILLPILPYVLIWLFRKRNHYLHLLLLTSLTGLCFGHHLIYDLLTLICVRLLSVEKDEKISSVELILITLLIVPIGAIADKTGLEFIHTLTPVILFVYFLSRLIPYIRNIYKPSGQ